MKYEFSDNEVIVIASLCRELQKQCNGKKYAKTLKISESILKKIIENQLNEVILR